MIYDNSGRQRVINNPLEKSFVNGIEIVRSTTAVPVSSYSSDRHRSQHQQSASRHRRAVHSREDWCPRPVVTSRRPTELPNAVGIRNCLRPTIASHRRLASRRQKSTLLSKRYPRTLRIQVTPSDQLLLAVSLSELATTEY